VTLVESSKDFELIYAVVVRDIQNFKLELIEKLPSENFIRRNGKGWRRRTKRLTAERKGKQMQKLRLKRMQKPKNKADAEA
jgi:hypothetical protein